ncbi:SRPBCC family protein [bacterium]|nr:SRPBCC family protein [bacterium]
MKVLNIHEREFGCPVVQVGALLDSLATQEDLLWPHETWPRMKFEQALSVGARGGHGPIRYEIEDYQPGRFIRFRFTGPRGFLGHHGYEIEESESGAILRQVLEMNTSGSALLTWPLIYRPMHDALIEDSLTKAEFVLGLEPEYRSWSLWVKCLRFLLAGRRMNDQKRLLA